MSFSREVKEELAEKYTKLPHCQKALLSALLIYDKKNMTQDADSGVWFYNFTSGRKTFNIKTDPKESPEKITAKTCCKRAFLRGAFIGAGTISDPEKEYRFDIISDTREQADFLSRLFSDFGIKARITKRREKYVLYLKEGEQISDALNVLEAHNAMMQFENVRILREMRGSVNRQVNCETANINKSVAAAMKQAEEIQFILEQIGMDKLGETLAAVAKARLAHPDVTLEELGRLMVPPLSKSAVNHRMRKISQIAEELKRQKREET